MLLPVWSFILGTVIFYTTEVHGQCWKSIKCSNLTDEDGIQECVKACTVDVYAVPPAFQENQIQPVLDNMRKIIMGGRTVDRRKYNSNYPLFNPLSSNDHESDQPNQMEEEALDRQGNKRSPSVNHFRWGKEVVWKRRRINADPEDIEEESSETSPIDSKREISLEGDYPGINPGDELEDDEKLNIPNKKYRLPPFGWVNHPVDNSYGGFMTSKKSLKKFSAPINSHN